MANITNTPKNVKRFNNLKIGDLRNYIARSTISSLSASNKIDEAILAIERIEPKLVMAHIFEHKRKHESLFLRVAMFKILQYIGYGSLAIGKAYGQHHSTIIYHLKTYTFEDRNYWRLHAKSSHYLLHAFNIYCNTVDTIDTIKRDIKREKSNIKPSAILQKYYAKECGLVTTLHSGKGLRNYPDSDKIRALSAVQGCDICSVSYSV